MKALVFSSVLSAALTCAIYYLALFTFDISNILVMSLILGISVAFLTCELVERFDL